MNDNLKDLGNGEVSLTSDGGDVIKFFHIGTITYGGEWFAFFQPAEKLDGIDPDELLIYKIEGDGRGENLSPVTDDDLIEKVYNEFLKEMEDDDLSVDENPCATCGGCAAKSKTQGCGGGCGRCNR